MALNREGSNQARQHIGELCDKVTQLYQSSREERSKLHVYEWELYAGKDIFTALGLMELLSAYLMGYASQIISKGFISDHSLALHSLQAFQLQREEAFAHWQISAKEEYPTLQLYSEKLDDLRMAIIDFINSYQG